MRLLSWLSYWIMLAMALGIMVTLYVIAARGAVVIQEPIMAVLYGEIALMLICMGIAVACIVHRLRK